MKMSHVSNYTPQKWGVGAKYINFQKILKLEAFLSGDHIIFSAFSYNFPYSTVLNFTFYEKLDHIPSS